MAATLLMEEACCGQGTKEGQCGWSTKNGENRVELLQDRGLDPDPKRVFGSHAGKNLRRAAECSEKRLFIESRSIAEQGILNKQAEEQTCFKFFFNRGFIYVKTKRSCA